MRARRYIYDSANASEHVPEVIDRLEAREESVEYLDVAAIEDPADALREATLAVKEGVGIGTIPEELFDAGGAPDFSTGALVTEAETGRRSLHVGTAALDVLPNAE